MRLTGALFARYAEVNGGMLYVMGGGWTNTTVPAGSTGFPCQCVMLCDTGGDDVGQEFTVLVDMTGPSGQTWQSAVRLGISMTVMAVFMVTPPAVFPIEPGGGRHVYTFRIEGRDDAGIALPLDVHLAPPPPGVAGQQ